MFGTLVGMYYVVAYLEYDRNAPGPSSGFECRAWAKLCLGHSQNTEPNTLEDQSIF